MQQHTPPPPVVLPQRRRPVAGGRQAEYQVLMRVLVGRSPGENLAGQHDGRIVPASRAGLLSRPQQRLLVLPGVPLALRDHPFVVDVREQLAPVQVEECEIAARRSGEGADLDPDAPSTE